MNRRILVVEDSGSQAEKLKLILELNKYECHVVDTAEEAVELLTKPQLFNALISDVILPGMTGYDLCQIIKRDPATAIVPVMLMTSSTAHKELVECIKSGADAFLTKPYNPDVLVSRLKFLLREPGSNGAAETPVFETNFLPDQSENDPSIAQLTNLLITTLEDVSRTNAELDESRTELQSAQKKLVQYAKLVEKELGTTQKQLDVRNKAIETLEHALLIITADDKGYVISDANSAIEAVTGYKPNDLIGNSPPIFTDNIESYVRFLDLLKSAENPEHLDSGRETLKIIHKDGSSRWCDFRVSIIATQQDSDTLFACALSDITSEYAVRLAMEYLSQRAASEHNYYSDSILKMSKILDADIAFISQLRAGQVDTMVICENGIIAENMSYPLEGSPFLNTIEQGVFYIQDNAQEEFPDHIYFQQKNIRSYMSIRIQNSNGDTIGHLGIMQRRRIFTPDSCSKVLKIFAIAIGAEIEREKAYKQYEDLFHFAPDAMLIIDEDGQILLVNNQAEKLFGYPPGELATKRVKHLFPKEQNKRYQDWIREYRSNPTKTSVGIGEVSLKCIDSTDKEFPVDLALNPVRTDDGHSVVMTIRDITLRLQHEEDLLARVSAEEANRAKSAFLATMSHEIRTPINGVIGSAELLARMSLGPEQVELVQTINESGNALLHVIDEILDFSKIEAGKLTVECELIDIEAVCESVCRSLSTVALKKKVTLRLFTDPALPSRVYSDAVRLRQILNNLISNALKFSGAKEGKGEVDVRVTYTAPGSLAIAVTDNGIGISEEYQAELFTPFTQEQTSTTRRFGGTGLGLTICKRLAELLGGDISVRSQVGEGTTFTVVLPLHDVPLDGKADKMASLDGLLCVLIADDQPELPDWNQYLSAAGARVENVESLEQADNLVTSTSVQKTIIISCMDPIASKQWFTNLRLSQNISLLILKGKVERTLLQLIAPSVLLYEHSILLRSKFLSAISIAAGRESLPVVHKIAEDGLQVSAKLPDRETAISRGELILVTEDNTVNQTVIRRQLAMIGFQADIVSDGKQGLQAWESGDYALLLTDLHMPEIDGYELTASIRSAANEFSQRPIIALTANALKGEKERCIKEGMNDYLSKPISLQNLQSKLEQWLPHIASRETESRTSAKRRRNGTNSATKPSRGPTFAMLNLNGLMKMVGKDPALINKLCTEFKRTLELDKIRIQELVANNNLGEISLLAHRIKSSARMFGAVDFADCCEAIETAGTSGTGNIDEHLLKQFDSLTEQVLEELNTRL